MTYDAENPGSGLRQAHKCDEVKLDEFLMVYLFEFNALASFSKFSWGRCGSDLYNYLCNQCLSPLMLWVRILLRGDLLDKTCDKVCQRVATGQWFSRGTPVSSTNKTDCVKYDNPTNPKFPILDIHPVVNTMSPFSRCKHLLVLIYQSVSLRVIARNVTFSKREALIFVLSLNMLHFWYDQIRVRMIASSVEDHGLEHQSGQTYHF